MPINMTQRQPFTHRVGRQVEILILACALASFCSTLYCPGRYGSAIWTYWRALRSIEIDAGERPLAESQPEGDVARLREEAIHISTAQRDQSLHRIQEVLPSPA